ncbi:MAG: sigma-54-dependent Fis family transcriptional regulator [Cereibacter sphaeroides]|uniref:Nif-specific regulatory protein n=1 Tax=Cereibacter sphaeroides TaxID=1063 RepID=A0A2W5UD13_CERSP|nr:MAG: sigma-54-dependent Fis family transcriptional regulator [Cereibacter sphaeroides]
MQDKAETTVPRTPTAEKRPSGATILLVEGAAALQTAYRSLLTRAGNRVRVVSTAAEARTVFADSLFPIVLLDLTLPDGDGLELLQDMLATRPETRAIVITANGSISAAVSAMRAGAQDFLVKPVEDARLVAAVRSAAEPPKRKTTAPHPDAPPGELFLGSSPTMTDVYGKIRSVAASMATVFITGESGTGKELCAQAVHDGSARASGPFIALNCGAIPPDLLESEVFGHMKGSFTGAISDKPGAAAAADGGTLFLDEICEMDIGLQTKLLRFLQTSMVQPVGATRPKKVNVRIVCATNRDPLDSVRRGQFREDLYYRLYVVPIHMPPLRERGHDVIEIAEAALARFSAEEHRKFDGLDENVRSLFQALPWPGNVRQLLNVIRNVVVLNEGGIVTPEMLPPDLVHQAEQLPAKAVSSPEPAGPTVDQLVGRSLAEIEQIMIEATIERFGGSVPKAARVLDVSPSTLYRKREVWLKAPGD